MCEMDGRLLFLLAAGFVARAEVQWRSLPALPEALGGQLVGTVGETLVVAGGSAWNKPPWAGGTKSWVDTIYVLSPNATTWQLAGRLPKPLAYGAAVDVRDGMLLIGGQSATGFSKQVLHLTLREGTARVRRLGDLPEPRAMGHAVVAGGFVYLAGGQIGSHPAQASNSFLSIALTGLLAGRSTWRTLPSWNGPARFFAQASACGDQVYLAGGSDLVSRNGGEPARRFLRDVHRYAPQSGWERLPDMPREAQAGVAACDGGSFQVFGGSDGTLSEELREKHPGFRRDILQFDPHTRTWREVGQIPASLVTTGIARWRGEYVIAGGEDRPGHRSATVVAARFSKIGTHK